MKRPGNGRLLIEAMMMQAEHKTSAMLAEREMRATVDHWKRVFACHLHRMEGAELARFNRFYDTYALTPHDPTGDERHGDCEYGRALRVELDDLGRECVYGGTCEPRSDDPDTCVECGRPR